MDEQSPDVADDKAPARGDPPLFTYTIAALAIIMSLLYWGERDVDWAYANQGVWSGQYWRLITSCFLHADLPHLVFNLYWLIVLGRVIEDWLSWSATCALFLLLAIGSSTAEFLVGGTNGIGLSGVVYGYFGVLVVTRTRYAEHARVMTNKVIQVFIVWLILCVALTWTGVWRIGNVAHLSGAVLGWLVGRIALRESGRVVCMMGVVAGVAASVALTAYMPWNYHWLWRKCVEAYDAEDYEEGREYGMAAIDRAPDDRQIVGLLEWAICSACLNGDAEKSLAILDRATAVTDDPKSMRMMRAAILLREGKRAAAEELFPAVEPERFDEFVFEAQIVRECFGEPESPVDASTTGM